MLSSHSILYLVCTSGDLSCGPPGVVFATLRLAVAAQQQNVALVVMSHLGLSLSLPPYLSLSLSLSGDFFAS